MVLSLAPSHRRRGAHDEWNAARPEGWTLHSGALSYSVFGVRWTWERGGSKRRPALLGFETPEVGFPCVFCLAGARRLSSRGHDLTHRRKRRAHTHTPRSRGSQTAFVLVFYHTALTRGFASFSFLVLFSLLSSEPYFTPSPPLTLTFFLLLFDSFSIFSHHIGSSSLLIAPLFCSLLPSFLRNTNT